MSSSPRLSAELATHDDPLTNDIPTQTHSRSYFVRSTFDFSGHLFPLTASASATDPTYLSLDPTLSSSSRVSGLKKIKTVTYLNTLSLVVGLQISNGIFSFSSPS